jgi:hypothetical protein
MNGAFLWIDESLEARLRVQSGKLVISSHDPRKVPQGLIHHWVGVMIVPAVSLDQVMHVLNSYDRYSEIYKSLIRKTSAIDQAGDAVKLNVLAVQKALSVTAAVNIDEEIQIAMQAPNRVSITVTPSIFTKLQITVSRLSMISRRIGDRDTSGAQ